MRRNPRRGWGRRLQYHQQLQDGLKRYQCIQNGSSLFWCCSLYKLFFFLLFLHIFACVNMWCAYGCRESRTAQKNTGSSGKQLMGMFGNGAPTTMAHRAARRDRDRKAQAKREAFLRETAPRFLVSVRIRHQKNSAIVCARKSRQHTEVYSAMKLLPHPPTRPKRPFAHPRGSARKGQTQRCTPQPKNGIFESLDTCSDPWRELPHP